MRSNNDANSVELRQRIKEQSKEVADYLAMIQDHPITPPPELVEQWSAEIYEQTACEEITCSQHIATQAARWGADQELEACVEWLIMSPVRTEEYLRAARRPKPPSLKEQALQALDLLKVDASTHGLGFDSSTIRRALESLPD